MGKVPSAYYDLDKLIVVEVLKDDKFWQVFENLFKMSALLTPKVWSALHNISLSGGAARS